MTEVKADDGDTEMTWKALTRRALHRSIPFDADRAVLFVRPREDVTWESRDKTQLASDAPNIALSGEEARTFYEDVISTPETPKPQVSRRERKRSKGNTKRPSNRESISKAVSILDLFRFAQDGDLASLTYALSNEGGGFDVNVTDQFDWTLLMSAAHAGQRAVVVHLLRAGAEWRGRVNKRGRSAVDLARSAGHPEVGDLIESQSSSERRGSRERAGGRRSTSSSSRQPAERSCVTDDNCSLANGKLSHFCDVCGVEISADLSSTHSTSTLHQFCCKHSPTVSNYGISVSNRGYQMMLREGWDPDNGGLGSRQQGRQFPVQTVLKRDRLGIGVRGTGSTKPRVTHFVANDRAAVKGAWEREVEEGRGRGAPLQGKRRKREREVERERRWEAKLRRYFNTD